MKREVTDRVYYSAGHTSRQEKKPKLPNKSPGRKLPGRSIPPLDPTESFSRPEYRPFAHSESGCYIPGHLPAGWVSAGSPPMHSPLPKRTIENRLNNRLSGTITKTHNALNIQYGSLGGSEKGGRVPLPPFWSPLDNVYCILGSGVVGDE